MEHRYFIGAVCTPVLHAFACTAYRYYWLVQALTISLLGPPLSIIASLMYRPLAHFNFNAFNIKMATMQRYARVSTIREL